MKLYHGTDDNELNLTEVTGKIDGWNIFYGMFFSTSLASAESHGDTIFETEISEDEIIEASALAYNEQTASIIKELYYDISDEEVETLIELASENESEYNCDAERFAEILSVEEEFVGWEYQNVAGYIAEKLGYKAVKCHDEHGTSYLVLPGNKIYREGE